jgi:hypothetical protein
MYIGFIALFFIKTIDAIAQPAEITKQHFEKISTLEPIPEPKPVNILPKPKTPPREVEKDLTAIQKQVQVIAKEYGWGEGEQWEALSWIIQKESSWNPNAQNKTSTAYGLFQFLDMTRTSYNCPKTADVEIQTKCGIKYIQARYKTPLEAQKFHQKKGWY